jgi:transcriptional regulator with XRE-family HTH domain
MALAAVHDEEIDPARRVLGLRIVSYRKFRGLDQIDVAAACKVSRALVSKWENGRAVPDALDLLPLCRVLGVPVQELLAPGAGELTLPAEYQLPFTPTVIPGGRKGAKRNQPTFKVFRPVRLA